MSSDNITKNTVLTSKEKQELNRIRTEIASEIGIPNQENVNTGNLSSRQNGFKVKNMVEEYENHLK
ncbi:alpha/beta-type small acid-soluble spore protein [Clostridium sp.]|uniref:alpha/beta-type small acid-soluble spore protein n=1 Tax=Clostridium sp. TaxID=1506 RepID=UPI00261AD28D|nr:alpha/beta-type small acid-soluble spore protein [Clostridium sp.]